MAFGKRRKEGDVIVEDIKRAVRYGQYKLCYDRLTKQRQLYDLKNDPNEKNDISSEKELAYSLFSRLEEFMKTGKKGK
jgi:arylsulfatase A-like enzyme